MTSTERRIADLAAPASLAARPQVLTAARAARGADRLRSRRSTRAVAYQIIVAASANPSS